MIMSMYDNMTMAPMMNSGWSWLDDTYDDGDDDDA